MGQKTRTMDDKLVNLYDENRLRHGPWERHHTNGQLWFRYFCVHGVLNGSYEHYYQDGTIARKGMYHNDKRHGPWTIDW